MPAEQLRVVALVRRDMPKAVPVRQVVPSVRPELIQIREAERQEVRVVQPVLTGIIQRPVQVLVRKTRHLTAIGRQ